VKYAWIKRHRAVWPVSLTCEVLRVSASGYYEHERRDGRPSPMRMSDDALLVHIKAIHAEVRGEYGWPRIWKELLARGIRVGKDRVQKLMQRHGIKARGKRKFIATTDSNHDMPVAENLLNREFQPAMPNAVWAGDTTYIATDEGWLYLAVVIDLFSRQIVGWSVQQHMRRELVMDALRMAWFRRHHVRLEFQQTAASAAGVPTWQPGASVEIEAGFSLRSAGMSAQSASATNHRSRRSPMTVFG
jgi:hypothetical protein